MTSHRRRDNDHSMFTSKTPHFFKVILQEAIRDGILGIPRNFVRKHGKQLSSPIQLEVPSGAIWQVELTKRDERVWLQKGWQEFANHYSLEFGSFVVFRYEGNAHFHVLIFDRSASEIEYPYTSTEDDYDMSVELCDEVSAGRKSEEKSDLPCPLPRKKMRTDSPNETGTNSKLENLSSNISPDDPNSKRIQLGNFKKIENSGCSTGQVDAIKGVGGISARRSVKTEVLSCWQQLTATEKAHAIQRASAFKSTENPVFMVVMRPSFVRYKYNMCIPLDFAREFLTMQKGNLTLCNSAGKTWPAKYNCTAENKNPHARLHGGWRAFAEDNNLDVGDICVFELIKNPEILMKVVIYPVVENASKACKSLAHGSVASRVKIRSLVSDTEPNCQQSQCPSSSREFKDPKLEKQKKSVDFQYLTKELGGEFKYCAKDDSGGKSGAWRCLKPDLMGKMQPWTPTEKQRACNIRASAFKSANPSFTVVMQPSYVLTGGSLKIPYQFAKRYFKKNGEITLRVSDGRTWIINYKRKVSNLSASAKFHSNSWGAFVLDNNLKVGDICVFELVKENGILLEVAIFSAADIASWPSSRLVSRKSKEKSHLPCPLPQKKMRTDSPNQPGTNSKLEVLSSGISPDDSKSRRINLGNLKKVEKSRCSTTGQLDATTGVGGITVQRSVKTEVLSCVQRLTATEKAHAVQRVSAFKSTENPVFMLVMKPSFVRCKYRMGIPTNFARKFLKMQNGNLTLCDSAGKTWPAKYYRTAENKKPNAHMYGGWRAFAEDNNLVVGDICVFELIKQPEILMKVFIYPAVENASKACRPLAHGSIASRVKIRSLVSDTEPNLRQSRCPSSSREFKDRKIEENGNSHSYIEILDDFPVNQKRKKELMTSPCFQPCKMMRTNPSGSIQAKGIKLEKQKKSVNFHYLTKELGGGFKYSAKDDSGGMSGARRRRKPDLMGKMQPLIPTEKERAFKSTNPFFTVVMQPSYVLTGSSLYIPEQFAKRYFKKNGEIILRVSDGRTWVVDYERTVSSVRTKAIFRSNSWKTFMLDNKLKVGDVCLFELIKENGNLLEVVIFSAADIASFSPSKLGDRREVKY